METKVRPKAVHIEFWDHCQCSGSVAELSRCEVVGLLYKEDALCYNLVCWLADQTLDDNSEQFAILKSAVIQITYLKQTRRKYGKAYKSSDFRRKN